MAQIFTDTDAPEMADTGITGERFDENNGYTNAYVHVRVAERTDGLYLVEVYDGDIGGPNSTWVTDLYDDRAEAMTAYEARRTECAEANGKYVDTVWG